MSTLKVVNVQHPSAADPAIELDAAGKLWLAGGKVLQVVRATDATTRTTTSASFVDAGIGVTITPQSATSTIILIWAARCTAANNTYMNLRITDSANNTISGAESAQLGDGSSSGLTALMTVIAYASPATTSAVTYKGRFNSNSGSAAIGNPNNTGQLYAIEVSA